MASQLTPFEDRLYTEYDLRGRLRLAIILSIVLFVFFLLLDWVYTPQFLVPFAVIRFSVAALSGVLLLMVNRARSNRCLLNIAAALVLIDALGIGIMIQFLGGFLTSYYQGLNIIVMGMIVIIPLAFQETHGLYLATWAIYAIPSFIRIFVGQETMTVDGAVIPLWRFVVNNLFFLTAIILVGAFGSYTMDQTRRRELRSRLKLEEATAQLQESNAKLKTLDELKTQFFANVNHELRTPLTLMLSPLKAVLEGRTGPVSPALKDILTTMQRNGYKLLKLINTLLDLTKFEEGKTRLNIKTLDVIEFTTSILASVTPLAQQKRIKLYFQHPPRGLDLTFDPDQFEKVVLNLLSNALKFTPSGGRITIYIEDRDATIALIVEDTGVGIPASMLTSIFDRFSQVDGSMSRLQEGTGLGLSLAREIVTLHAGTIKAESEPGKGSRFIVEMRKGDAHFLPDVLEAGVETRATVPSPRLNETGEFSLRDVVADFRMVQLIDLERVDLEAGPPGGVRTHDALVLVIDDNPEVLKLMKVLLGDEFDLELATSAEKGLGLLQAKSPDLVLCDIMMPGMDGHAFARAVKNDEALKHIPIILVTARAGAESLADGLQAGADDYIAKPFDSVELKARIRALLRMRQIESELALANRNLKMRTSDLVEQQRSLYLSTVKSLASAIDAKDEHTRHHSTRVTEFCLNIGKAMGFSQHELEDLELAALLHDVGKIAVPEAILHKTGALTDAESGLIKEHPVRGESILKPVVELRDIARVVRSHHEHYDGTGYPDGIKGREIPVGARIMAVADAYDSITSARPYRNAASIRAAIKEIIRCSGTQFDPEVVEHFLEVIHSPGADQNYGGPAPRS
jgi:response regulator RpfG family c-di-GMP phosphodiesterase/signal transduction histidine kinase